MIEVQQWRDAIGCFAGGKISMPATSRDTRTRTMVTSRSWYGITIVGLLLCSYSLITLSLLLICSGNVESNPGPLTCKTCPICLCEKVPLKLKGL